MTLRGAKIRAHRDGLRPRRDGLVWCLEPEALLE
jgi:hypothetical protein